MKPTVLKRATVSHSWAVSKTIQADGKGAVRLTRRYGDALVCVRYRISPDGAERMTTVELVVDRVPVQRKSNPVVMVKIYPSETALIDAAKGRGARYNAKTRLWRMTMNDALVMGLKGRVARDEKQE